MRTFQSPEELKEMLLPMQKCSLTYQKIALYIEQHYLEISFMTASELADALGVSQGSVSRFFMMMGYRGYNEFLRNLQRMVSKQLTAPDRLRYTRSKPSQHGGPLRTILDLEIENMDRLTEILHGKGYQALLEAVCSEKKLVLISARLSATLLPYAQYLLNKMRPDVVSVVPGDPAWSTLPLLDPEKTTVIAFAFPRYPNVLIDKCRLLHERGIPLLAVTDTRLSPVVPCAQQAVFVPVTTSSLFDIYSTPLAFINLWLREAASKMKDLPARIEAIEENERQEGVYFSNYK